MIGMEELAWAVLVAAPLLVCAGVGQVFPRTWQRVVFPGMGAAGIYASVLYSMQADMVGRAPLSVATAADPLRVAAEAALVALPAGMLAGFAFHLLTRFIRTKKA